MGDRPVAAESGPVPAHAVGPQPTESAGNSTALAYAFTLAEAHYGAGWVWNPARWQTADGYVPWPVFLVDVDAMTGHQFLNQLLQALAQRLSQADETAMSQAQTRAFPGSTF